MLGNPVRGDAILVDVTSAGSQPVKLLLTDVQGRVLAEQQTERAGSVERYRLAVSPNQAGILLLQVSTRLEKQTIRLIR